jgi:PhzF family phenazine biosynthesis protein
MRGLRFRQVDVFTSVPFRGNPVAVVLDAGGLDTAQMQRIANWTNLSETTFVVPKASDEADYAVRIFTPASELPFAGHPTIGTAHALLEAGVVSPRDGRLVQECAAGLVRLEIDEAAGVERSIAFELPPADVRELTDAQAMELAAILGTGLAPTVRPRLVDVGPRWVVAQLPGAAAVIEARPDLQRMKVHDLALGTTGVIVFGEHPPGAGAAVEVRAFAPSCGIDEDPVCGSGNGCMAVFIRETGQAGRFGERFVATQGRVVGRDGRLRIDLGRDRVRVGGAAVTCIEGTISVPAP